MSKSYRTLLAPAIAHPLEVGTKLVMLTGGSGDVDLTDRPGGDVEYRTYGPGAVVTVERADFWPPHQNWAYTVLAPNGVVNVIDETDGYPFAVIEENGAPDRAAAQAEGAT